MNERPDELECKQKKMLFIFVVDTSCSMNENGRIQAVNLAFEALISGLKEIQEEETEWDMQLAILTFDQSARWDVPLTSVSEYEYQELHCLAGKASYAEAFRNLVIKLSRSEYMAHKGKLAQPQIFFLTASEPAEVESYQEELEKLLRNLWFKESMRTAILVGDAAGSRSAAARAAENFVGMNVNLHKSSEGRTGSVSDDEYREYGIYCLEDEADVSLCFQAYLDQFKHSLLLSKSLSNGGVYHMDMEGLSKSDSNDSDEDPFDWFEDGDSWDEIIESLPGFDDNGEFI